MTHSDSTSRLITCDNLQEAYLIKGRLANEGIDSSITNEHFTNLMPLYNNTDCESKCRYNSFYAILT